MSKVAYFSNQFATANGHGIARYAHHLFEALQQLPNSPEVIPVAAWSNRAPKDLEFLKQKTNLQILPWGRRMTPLAWKYFNFPKLEQGLNQDIDLVHAVSLGYSIATDKPYIVTVHDIGPLTHPQFFTKKDQWLMAKSLEQAVKKATALICVSHTTANELEVYVQKHYGTTISNRIEVALEGVSIDFFKPSEGLELNDKKKVEGIVDQPFILAVGKISPRKNLKTILESMALCQKLVPHNLITVGGNGWDFDHIEKEVNRLGLEGRVHFLGYVSDELLRFLYQKASVFVYPSLFEGFGLTILEAMASGCPVITSNISSLPEVAGEAGIKIDPCNSKSLSTAIEAVCLDLSLAGKMKQEGLNHARKFTWEKCAKRINSVYDKAL